MCNIDEDIVYLELKIKIGGCKLTNQTTSLQAVMVKKA